MQILLNERDKHIVRATACWKAAGAEPAQHFTAYGLILSPCSYQVFLLRQVRLDCAGNSTQICLAEFVSTGIYGITWLLSEGLGFSMTFRAEGFEFKRISLAFARL